MTQKGFAYKLTASVKVEKVGKLRRDFKRLIDEIDNSPISVRSREKFRTFGQRDKSPNIPSWDEIKSNLSTFQSCVGFIPAILCDVDRCYDRNIDWVKIQKHIKQAGGFSYDACGIITVVYDIKRNRFIVVIGQHRVVKSLLCLGRDAQIPAKIILLDESKSEGEQIEDECRTYDFEANNITPQKVPEKILTAYISGTDKEARQFVDLCKRNDICVTGMEGYFKGAEFSAYFKTPWSLRRAFKIVKDTHCDESNVEFALQLLRDYLQPDEEDKANGETNDIVGKELLSVTQFLCYFENKIQTSALANNLEPHVLIKKIFNFTFNEEGNDREEWLLGTNVFRGESTVIPVARLIRMTNKFFRKNKFALGDGRKATKKSKWCSTTEDAYLHFLDKTNTQELLRQLPNSIIDQM